MYPCSARHDIPLHRVIPRDRLTQIVKNNRSVHVGYLDQIADVIGGIERDRKVLTGHHGIGEYRVFRWRAEPLDAIGAYIRDIEISGGRSDGDRERHLELADVATQASPLGQVIETGIEFLDTSIGGIGHVNVAAGVESDPLWGSKLRRIGTVSAPGVLIGAGGREALNAVVQGIRDIDITRVIQRDTGGRIETGRTASGTTPSQGRGPAGEEFLYTVITLVHHINIAVLVNGDSLRVVEQADAGACTSPPGDIVPGCVEFLDAVIPAIGDINIVTSYGDPGWVIERPNDGAGASPLRQ